MIEITDISDKKYHSLHITIRFIHAMDKILEDRTKTKVTAREFGDIVGIKSSNIKRLRDTTGENTVTVEALGRICEYYNVSPNWLLTGKGEMMNVEDIRETCSFLDKRVTEIEDKVAVIELMINQSNKAKKRG